MESKEFQCVGLAVGLESQSAKLLDAIGTLDVQHGTLKPQYDTLGDTLALSDDTLASKLIALIRENPQITQVEMVSRLSCSIPTVKRITKRLSEKGIITRKGGKRYGYWEVL